MSHDPIRDLRAQLLTAAELRLATYPATAPSSSPWRWPRRPLLVALAALVVAAPAGGVISGVLELGSGSTPDGGSYQVSQTTDASGRVCQATELRGAGGHVTRVEGCAAADFKTTQPVAANVMVAPGQSRLVTATVSEDVARVSVTGVTKPIELRPIAGQSRRFVQAVTTGPSIVVTAYDGDGRELQRVDMTSQLAPPTGTAP